MCSDVWWLSAHIKLRAHTGFHFGRVLFVSKFGTKTLEVERKGIFFQSVRCGVAQSITRETSEEGPGFKATVEQREVMSQQEVFITNHIFVNPLLLSYI